MVIIGLLLILLLGYLIVNLLDFKFTLYEKMSTGFLISTGFSTFLWFLFTTIGFTFDLNMCLIVLTVSIFLFLILNIMLNKINFSNIAIPKINKNKFQLVVILLILVAVGSSLVANLYWPIRDWDALTLYDFRGKFFASENSISEVFKIHRYYLGYPLYTSLLHAFVYLLDTQGNPLFIYTLIYASFIVAFYFSLKRITNNRIALIFTFIIAFTFEIFDHSLLSYTNLPYSAFLLLGYLYFINYVKDTKLSSLILASLLIGLSGWIRSSDPFWIPALLLMIYESIKNKKFNHLAMFIAIILTIRLPWNYFVSEISKGYSVTSSNNFNLIFTTSISKYIDRLFLVIPYVWINVIKPQFSVYLMFVLTLLMYIPKPSSVLTITRLLILINLCVIIGGVYFYSIVYEKWQVIGNSVTRMSIFMTPLILIAVAITVSHKYSNLFSNEK